MITIPTALPGCVELVPPVHRDARGRLVKPFESTALARHGLDGMVAEMFYTSSVRGVVRGLHFQCPPHGCAKVVTCVVGEVFDAVVDLRVDSPFYGRHQVVHLSGEIGNALAVPEGVAHGFQALTDGALVVYLQSRPFDASCDRGIHFESAGIPWPLAVTTVSERDRRHPPLSAFASPFRLRKSD